MRDISFLNIKPEDSEHIKSLKSHWSMVMGKPLDERLRFLQEERIGEEEQYLEWMIDSNKGDDEAIVALTNEARSIISSYEMLQEESLLNRAELVAEFARSIKDNKFTIRDIRRQRERVQWEKKKLN